MAPPHLIVILSTRNYYALRMPGIPGLSGPGCHASRITLKLGQTGKHNTDIDYNYRSNQFENQTAQLSSPLTPEFSLSL